MVTEPIDPPLGDARLEMPVDTGAVGEAVWEIASRVRAASRPVLIAGVEVHRFKLRDRLIRLAEKLNLPVASSFLGRGAIPTRHPQFVGTYLGVVSPPELRSIVEESDCVLLVGERISDTSLGVSANRLTEKNLLIVVARDVFIGHHRYEYTPIDQVVAGLESHAALPARTTPWQALPAYQPRKPQSVDASTPVSTTLLIDVLNEFVEAHPEVPLVCDTGDSLFASVEIRSNEIVAPAYYATMGFAVPAAIGVQTSTGRRPLVLMGDGAFQMTGPEIAHAPGYGCNPVIVLVNNNRWEMLQAFYPHAAYNDTVAWPFAKLASLWGGDGHTAGSVGELRRALDEAWASPRFSIVEVPVPRGDISPVLARFVQAFKERVYRPR
jgi:indolepyruvate decarboxylase